MINVKQITLEAYLLNTCKLPDKSITFLRPIFESIMQISGEVKAAMKGVIPNIVPLMVLLMFLSLISEGKKGPRTY